MTTYSIILIWAIVIIIFGIYWHVPRISQKLTKCLAFRIFLTLPALDAEFFKLFFIDLNS